MPQGISAVRPTNGLYLLPLGHNSAGFVSSSCFESLLKHRPPCLTSFCCFFIVLKSSLTKTTNHFNHTRSPHTIITPYSTHYHHHTPSTYKITIHQPTVIIYRDADKSLARSRREQATATEDFQFHISYL